MDHIIKNNILLNRALRFFEEIGEFFILCIDVIAVSFKPPFRYRNIIKELDNIGIQSLFVVLLTGAFTGMVMALQSINVFAKFNAEGLVGSTVAISVARELGPVLTAFMVTGRAGSALATELGSMRVTEQIDALITLDANPIQYLSVPRFLACLVMTPVLVVVTDVVGSLGGAFIAYFNLGITIDKYVENVFNYLGVMDFLTGIFKSVFFGIEIAIIACYQGFNTFGGAEGVGKATIRAVVASSMTILISDYFLTYLLQFIE